jgi:uncharacterized protein YfdQ (DUF2303 family)
MDSLEKINNDLMNTEALKCDAATGVEAGLKIATLTQRGDINGMPVAILPEGFGVKQFPELLSKPFRKIGTMKLLDLESFARFFKTHQTGNSIIVADVDPKGARGAKFTAVFNYHGKDAAGQDFGDFRAEYTAQLSVEWARWMAQNGKPMEHAAFLEHLEVNQDIIIEPGGAALLELISSLEGKVSARFSNALNLHNGKAKLSFDEDVELRGTDSVMKSGALEVPTELKTALSPFEFGDAYKVRNRLRYRVASRQLVFAYEVVDPHKIIQDAAAGQMKRLAELTEVVPFYGQI